MIQHVANAIQACVSGTTCTNQVNIIDLAMVRESFYHDVLLQWIPQDSDGLLLNRCDKASRICLSAASKALRSSFGHWLVTQYTDSISSLEECGFLCCKLFVHHGGLDTKITMAKALPGFGFGGLLWREDLSMYPLDIIAAADRYQINHVFYHLAEHFPCFMGSVFAELFSRQGGKDGPLPEKPVQELLLKAMATLETVLTKWQTDVGRDYYWRLRRVNELVANMICSIPPAEALRCGIASWFVKLTKRNILDSTTSSTATFLKILRDRDNPDALFVEFMNILCATSHCGHAPEAVVVMFEACLQVLEDDTNLGSSTDCGVQLCQALSILAKVKSLWGGPDSQKIREFHLKQILDKAFERHKALFTDGDSSVADVLEQICDGRHLQFYPQSFTHEEQRLISQLETRLFDAGAAKLGRSMRWDFIEHAAWNSIFLKGFLRAKTYHFYLTYGCGPGERQEEIEACRMKWVRQWLRGVITVLRQDSIPVYSGRVEVKTSNRKPCFKFVAHLVILGHFMSFWDSHQQPAG